MVGRPRLERRLREALGRRLTCLVADAGFGKSTLLAGWAAGQHAAWYTVTASDGALGPLTRGLVDALRLRVPGLPPDLLSAVGGSRGPDADADEPARAQAFGGLICQALEERLPRDLVLILDDVQELDESDASAQLIGALCRQAPDRLHLVLASRREPPFPVARLRGQGQVLDLGGPELAFTPEETTSLLEQLLGTDATALGEPLHAATAGWPAAVRLAIEALRTAPPEERAGSLVRVRRPGGPLYAYLAEEVFARERPEVRNLLRRLTVLDRFTPGLCEAFGVRRAAETLVLLERRGLYVSEATGTFGWLTLGPLVREYLSEGLPLEPAEAAEVHRIAAIWFEANGFVTDALRSLLARSDLPGAARLLRDRGTALLTAGAAEAVIHAAGQLDARHRDAAIHKLEGEARQLQGDWEGALAAFGRAAGRLDVVDPAIAWRMGLIHYLRGNLDEAIAWYGRGVISGDDAPNEALLEAWWATAHWIRGDTEACRRLARSAHERATASGDHQALAASHTVLALVAVLDGDRRANDGHYLRALDHAEQARDVLQTIRIRTNRGSRLNEEGLYEDAIAELEIAIRLADLAGFATLRAIALNNRGEARHRLGRLEEGLDDLEAARALCHRLGLGMISYPLGHLGDLHRDRGDRALARAAYEEALALSRANGDLQGLVPALSGLALTLADDDLDAARQLADEAVACGPVLGHVAAVLARGWIALAEGAIADARARADEAASKAGVRRDRAGLAEALELRAATVSEQERRTTLEEALGLWRDLRSPMGEARVFLALARTAAEGSDERTELAGAAERRFRELGARRQALEAAALLAAARWGSSRQVVIQCLGGFGVSRFREPVGAGAWQSRKARDLLKILVAREGGPVHREILMEALWPEEDPERTTNRLSVALSTARAVLDPEHRFDADHFVPSERDTVALDLRHAEVDVIIFLSRARKGLARRAAGDAGWAEELAAVEATYLGDFLEEDPFEEWAVPLRERARATYVEVVRALAAHAAEHDAGAAARYYLRILERDPYDEGAHLGLVAALARDGRHGEARRFYRSYSGRMEELGVEPAAFPAVGRAAA